MFYFLSVSNKHSGPTKYESAVAGSNYWQLNIYVKLIIYFDISTTSENTLCDGK